VLIEPAVILIGTILKNPAQRYHEPFPEKGSSRTFIFLRITSSIPFS
jgi:hypothetical protein